MRAKHLRSTPALHRVGRAVTVSAVIASALAVGGTAMAAKTNGGSSSGSSLSVSNETAPGQAPAYGQTITFNVTSPVYKKWVDLTCYQNGAFVYSDTKGFYPDYPWAPDYMLTSAYWTSGAADCKARLYTQSNNGKQSTLATLSFTVSA